MLTYKAKPLIFVKINTDPYKQYSVDLEVKITMINPVPTRVEDILNAPTQYAIPLYQRDFKWGENEARDFIEDLNS